LKLNRLFFHGSRDVEVEEAGKQPSRSYAYRVLLDRDDHADADEPTESDVPVSPSDIPTSHGGRTSDEKSPHGGCQPAGTPVIPSAPVPTVWHGGANACTSTPANAYVGTNNVPFERPLSERLREGKRTGHGSLAEFKRRWPTAAVDSQEKIDAAWAALSPDETDQALAGIDSFLAKCQAQSREKIIAGWTFLREKRWTFLGQAQTPPEAPASGYGLGTTEARAIETLYAIVGHGDFFANVLSKHGTVRWSHAVTPQIRALASASEPATWIFLTRVQAAAWERFIEAFFDQRSTRKRLREGSPAPWEWPPSIDGSLSDSSD